MSSLYTQMPLRLPFSLHRDLKIGAESEGVSLNQYCLYLLARSFKKPEEIKTKKLQETLNFLEQARLFQKQLKKNRTTPLNKKEVVYETPKQRLKKLYAKNRSSIN